MLPTTHWSLVVAARGSDESARAALGELCRVYRGAVFAYARRHARSSEEAEDLTQAFFVDFLEHQVHVGADPQRGRFRAYLFTALARFVNHARLRDGALKRGGDCQHVPLDAQAEDTCADDDTDTPEQAFERAWAYVVLEHALERLAREQARAGRALVFARLREFLLEPPAPSAYEAVARELGLRANTVAVNVHRLRERLRELVREALQQTVATPAALEDELHALRAALQPER